MSRYTVAYVRDAAGWWVATVRGVKGCHTQGRTIAEARRRIREALGLFVEGASEADLADQVQLPQRVRAAVKLHVQQAQKLVAARERAREATARAVSILAEELGLSVRDTGAVLGMTHQRVQQIARRSGGRGSEERADARAVTERPRPLDGCPRSGARRAGSDGSGA